MQIISFIFRITKLKIIDTRLRLFIQIRSAKIICLILLSFANQSCSTTTILKTTPNTVESFMMHRSDSIINKDYTKISSDKLLKHSIFLTMTGFGFIMENAEKTLEEDYKNGLELYKEANQYFDKAVVLGNKYLKIKYPNFDEWLFEKSYSNIEFVKEDVEALYWLAAAYGGAVSSSQGNPKWVIHLPKVGRLIEKGIELDPRWNYGSLYSAMISYSTTVSDSPENDWDQDGNIGGYNRFGLKSIDSGSYNSKGIREAEYIGVNVATNYYNLALQASNSMDLSTHVSFAENVLVFQQNKTEFVDLLNHVLQFEENKIKDLKLGNYLAKQRAQWLLGKTEELFY